MAFPDKALLGLLVEAGVAVLAGSNRRWHTWRRLTHGVWQSRKRSGHHEGWHGLQLLEPVRLLPGLARAGRKLPAADADLAAWVRMRPQELPPEIREMPAWADERPKVAVHPGSHGSANNISVARYAALVEQLVAAGWQVWVTGTAAERAGLADLPWQLPGVVNVTGRLSVEALMGFLGQTDLCIAASTGPLHLAAVLGTPVVGLFGGEAPVWSERWKPIGPRVEVLVTAGEADDGGLDLRPEEIVAVANRIGLSCASDDQGVR
jgi:ADP-heptose:LPS heptosyltransferase